MGALGALGLSQEQPDPMAEMKMPQSLTKVEAIGDWGLGLSPTMGKRWENWYFSW